MARSKSRFIALLPCTISIPDRILKKRKEKKRREKQERKEREKEREQAERRNRERDREVRVVVSSSWGASKGSRGPRPTNALPQESLVPPTTN